MFCDKRGRPDRSNWANTFDFILVSPQCPPELAWNSEVVIELIEHISSSLSVDRDRVYLTGYSMGGNATWAAASYDPGRFAAIAPLCGGGDASQVERLAKVPIWAFHGAKDQTIPLKLSEDNGECCKEIWRARRIHCVSRRGAWHLRRNLPESAALRVAARPAARPAAGFTDFHHSPAAFKLLLDCSSTPQRIS